MKKNVLQEVTREEQYTVTVVDVEETAGVIIPAVTHEEIVTDISEIVDEITGEVTPAVTHIEIIIDSPEIIKEAIPAVTHEEVRTRLVTTLQSITVDMTAEEEEEYLAGLLSVEPANGSLNLEDRVGILENDTATLTDAINILLGVGENA